MHAEYHDYNTRSEFPNSEKRTQPPQKPVSEPDGLTSSLSANSIDNLDARNNLRTSDYLPIEHYGIIGNTHTAALCSTDGSIDFLCYPKFDSPSVFGRILDKNKGGYFSVTPKRYTGNKQQYLPSSNILNTRFLHDDGVAEIIDYMHIPTQKHGFSNKSLLPWVIRSVKVIRGQVDFLIECCPAFNYARDEHTTFVEELPTIDECTEKMLSTKIYPEDDISYYVGQKRAVFKSKDLTMDLRYIVKCGESPCPVFNTNISNDWETKGLKGPGVWTEFQLQETQEVIFILREVPKPRPKNSPRKEILDPPLTASLMDALFKQTSEYWQNWVNLCTYRGRWKESVIRSALTLKLLTYEPTGAVISTLTFGLVKGAEDAKNWDYRNVWIRDSSFTIYAFLRLGFTQEAEKYMHFISERCNDLNADGSLNAVYSIDGAKRAEEVQLDHLDGYRSSGHVRVGVAAHEHVQLDIYGDLLDGIYLYNKYGSPISYDMWCNVRKLVNYVTTHWNTPGTSIWDGQGEPQRFTYSLVMCWVAIDRGLRLSEKNMLPCPDRAQWHRARNEIYMLIQNECYNTEEKVYTQSVESPHILDASILIMPLVFFSSPVDPRLLSTLHKMMQSPEKGGLVANDLVFRYNLLKPTEQSSESMRAFSMCTFWFVEALARAGKYDKTLKNRAIFMFEKMLSNANQVGLFSEEVARSGELLGNFPQAFTHTAFISAAFNLNRVLGDRL